MYFATLETDVEGVPDSKLRYIISVLPSLVYYSNQNLRFRRDCQPFCPPVHKSTSAHSNTSTRHQSTSTISPTSLFSPFFVVLCFDFRCFWKYTVLYTVFCFAILGCFLLEAPATRASPPRYIFLLCRMLPPPSHPSLVISNNTLVYPTHKPRKSEWNSSPPPPDRKINKKNV